jgi:hypothetical protein
MLLQRHRPSMRQTPQKRLQTRFSLPKPTASTVRRVLIVRVRLVVLVVVVVVDFLKRLARRRVQHPKQTEVESRQVKQELLERLVFQESRDVSFDSRQNNSPQPATALEGGGSVVVDREDGVDEIVVVSDRSDLAMNGVALAEDLLGESAKFRDVVLIRDGVDVDVVGAGGGGASKRRGVAENEVIEIVDQSTKDVGIVVGEVEGGGVGLLLDRGWSDSSSKDVVVRVEEGK